MVRMKINENRVRVRMRRTVGFLRESASTRVVVVVVPVRILVYERDELAGVLHICAVFAVSARVPQPATRNVVMYFLSRCAFRCTR